MAAKSLDALRDVDTVRRQQSETFRQVRKPQFCLVVNPSEPLQSAEALAETIRRMLCRCSCPVFLYIDDEMHAYVIPEDRPIAQQWARPEDLGGHWRWLVAVYAYVHRAGQPMLRPTVNGIADDLREHAADLQRVPA